MHFNLETPPNGPTSEALFQSFEHNNTINNTALLYSDVSNYFLPAVSNISKNVTVLSKISKIFKTKQNVSTDIEIYCQGKNGTETQNIEEHHGVYTSNDILVNLL